MMIRSTKDRESLTRSKPNLALNLVEVVLRHRSDEFGSTHGEPFLIGLLWLDSYPQQLRREETNEVRCEDQRQLGDALLQRQVLHGRVARKRVSFIPNWPDKGRVATYI